ncbi:hypothetical protein DFH11DRAFT_499063 [Phellopilus nigrolimitatus]|nr:hypothetical protein DFH11DRAFT_499063 [Phellopilus nigrolimitatus]
MQIPRYETQTPDVKAARQPSFSAGPSGAVAQPAQTYAPYVAYSSGQYPYGTGTYSYYSHPPAQPGIGGSTVPYTPILPQHMTGAMPYSGQPPYPYYGYSATVGPPPGAYVPPGAPPAPAAQRIAPTYSMFSVSGAKPRSSPFSQAFQQTLASSVASLPPRTALPDSGSPAPTPSEQRRRQLPAQADQVPAFTQPLIPPPAMSSTPDPTPTQQPPETDTAPVVGGALPPDVMQAVEELQALSALEPAQLQEVLNARPALREAVKLLLAHQPFQSI